jgi:hypothetical protein
MKSRIVGSSYMKQQIPLLFVLVHRGNMCLDNLPLEVNAISKLSLCVVVFYIFFVCHQEINDPNTFCDDEMKLEIL